MKFSLMKGMLGLFIAVSLSACGGGGGDGNDDKEKNSDSLAVDTNISSPEGVYEGTFSTGKYFNTIILENNLFYTSYGEIVNDEFLVEGFFTGTGQTNGTQFTATDVRDFDASGLDGGGTLTATFKPGESFNGSTSGGVSFTSAPPTNTSYNYNASTNLSNIVGTWSMRGLPNIITVTVEIASSGNYTASYDNGNCEFEGRFTPRASGKNVFDVSVTGGGGAMGAICEIVVPGTSAHAVEFVLPGGQRQLLIAGIDEERENGTLLIGAR